MFTLLLQVIEQYLLYQSADGVDCICVGMAGDVFN